jgi:hypothetical protein
MQRWPDTLILARAPRQQSRSDRRHFAAPLTGPTEGQRRLRHTDCSATGQSKTDKQSGPAGGTIGSSASPDQGLGLGPSPGRRRTPPDPGLGLGLGPRRRRSPPDPGLGLGLSPGRRRTPPDPGLELGLSPGRRRTPPDPGLGLGLSPGRRRTPPDPGLELGLSPGRRRTPPDPGLGLGLGPRRRRSLPRPTQGSDLGLAPEDDDLRLARPRARTWARPQKTTISASPNPGARTRPRLRRGFHIAQPRA